MGALDGLVLDAVVEAVEPAAQRGELGSAVMKWAKEDPDRIIAAFGDDNPRASLASLARERLSSMTFQRSQMIEGVLWDIARIPSPWRNAADQLSEDGDAWDDRRVRSRLDEFVIRRHRIAHSGDLSDNGQSTRAIQLDYVREASKVIRAVGFSVCGCIDDRVREIRRRPRDA